MENTSDSFMPRPLLFCLKSERSVCYSVPDNTGCKFDTMLCIVGGQGIGKSTMFRFLAIKDEWFTDDLKKINDEKCFEKLMGHWIIEMSEMLALKSAKSIEDLKAFITRQSDTYRVPYAKFSITAKRQSVFCGTSNNYDFMPDDKTGNRRFLPLVSTKEPEVHPLENEYETRLFVNSAWAEAMEIYRSGKYKTILSSGLNKYLKDLQRDLMPEDTKVGVIQEWLDNYSGDRVCSLMLYKEALDNPYNEPEKKEISAINSIMNHNIEGWEKSTIYRFRNGYGRQRSWQRKWQQKCEPTTKWDPKKPTVLYQPVMLYYPQSRQMSSRKGWKSWSEKSKSMKRTKTRGTGNEYHRVRA